MSADEDTELRDLVAQTLEANGVLGKIRAHLRASVFLALEEQESNKAPFISQELKTFLTTKEGRAVTGLVREFLEFFNLEFTLAVFEPESGLGSSYEGRGNLAREFGVHDSDGPPRGPLLAEVLRQHSAADKHPRKPTGTEGGEDDRSAHGHVSVPQDLTSRQIAEARQKFDDYDRDNSSEIDKDELRELFKDMFPSFNRNMLDRYVNDEFNAADKDFSKGISFEEFLGMYKRLFLQCRTVVSGDVADIVRSTPSSSLPSSSAHSSGSKGFGDLVDSKNQRNLETTKTDMRNGPRQPGTADLLGSDLEEDPFFDDPISSGGRSRNFGSDADKSKPEASNGIGKPASPTRRTAEGSAMSSLQGLPALGQDRGASKNRAALDKDLSDAVDKNLQAMDQRIADLGLGDGQDDDYDDDFQSSLHSLSEKSPRSGKRSEQKSQNENGSIAEEIEEIEDLSVEAIDDDDLLKSDRSDRSGVDDLTTDRTISQYDGGFDYMEDIQSP